MISPGRISLKVKVRVRVRDLQLGYRLVWGLGLGLESVGLKLNDFGQSR